MSIIKHTIREKLKTALGFYTRPVPPKESERFLYCEPVIRVSFCLSGAGSFLLKGNNEN